MRADRLLRLILLLQARGRMTARALAAELEVSVRTVYRDLEALSGAGVPVYTESGPGGGCQLLDGYRSPLPALSPDEAAALLALGIPEPLRDLGLDTALAAAHGRVRTAAGLPADPAPPLVHLDMPRWFHSREPVPHLATVAAGVRHSHKIAIAYRRRDTGPARSLTVEPLGLVNKAGIWYLVAAAGARTTVFRAGRITDAQILDETFERPPAFDLAAYWDAWSADFQASLPHLGVTVRASPVALRLLTEIFGDGVRPALATAGPPDDNGWRTLTLSFEHEGAAAYRLAGFGDLIEVVAPGAVRDLLTESAQATLRRYGAG